MSNYEWEEGSIKLPTSEFARVRQVVADLTTKNSDAIYAKAQEFWGGLTAKQKSDPEAYRAAFNAFREKSTKRVHGGFWGGSHEESTLPEGFDDHVFGYAAERAAREKAAGKTVAFKPHRLQKSDLTFPTKKDLVFQTWNGLGTITFDRDTSSVHWYVGENNHAVDGAHQDPLAEEFFAALSMVKWTRGTGGYFLYGSEYDREAAHYSPGAGGSSISRGFGPVGAVDAPYSTADYVMADGTRVNQRNGGFEKVAKAARAAQRRQTNARLAAAGAQGRVGRGVPTGGQFSTRRRGESTIWL